MLNKFIKNMLVLSVMLLSVIAESNNDEVSDEESTPELESPSSMSLGFVGESVSNLDGGLKTGTKFDALLFGVVSLNSNDLGLAKGGLARISAVTIDGGFPSSSLIGDTQVVSNIEANKDTLIYEAWYRQDFSQLPLRLRMGIINANDYFNVNDGASMLLNSSFGIGAAASANAPFSIYPKPGYGIMTRFSVEDDKILVGVFDGNPGSRSIDFNQGQLSIAEWQHQLNAATEIKLGGWLCDCSLQTSSAQKQRTYGSYGSIEGSFKDSEDNEVTVFLRSAISHGANTRIPSSFSFGIYYPAFFKSRPNDEISAGVTRANLPGNLEETAYEVSYRWFVNKQFNFQPDLQFIQTPNGNLPDAWVLNLRINYLYEHHFENFG
jgi:porin